MFCSIFIGIIVVEAVSKYYWRVLNVHLKRPPRSIVSPICFELNRMENGNKDSSSEAYL
jgi:hypothetical protein